MDHPHLRGTGSLALATGVAAAGSAACLASYFAVGPPFGALNDLGNAATGVLGGLLALRLRRHVSGRTGNAAVAAALAGAAITVLGSALVVSGTTGFLLAGLVSSVGFAGTGSWLVVLNRQARVGEIWPRRLRVLGIAAGALMTLGIAAAPGVALRLDDVTSAPGWVWIGFVSWAGTYLAFPAWALSLAAVARSRADVSARTVEQAVAD